MDNSIKDINHSLSIQAETLGEPAETEASWYAMRVFMNKVALCRDLFNQFNNVLKDSDQMKNTFPEDMMGDVMEYYAPFVIERHVNSQGKKIVVERPLIPSLFFMRSNKRQALCLEQELCGKARLYRQLVDFDPHPIAIPKRQMQMFMMVSSGDQEGLEYFEDGAFNWKKGERVRVIDGRFKGLEGEIKRINGDHRLIVTIEGICAVATTYIPRCFLEKI